MDGWKGKQERVTTDVEKGFEQLGQVDVVVEGEGLAAPQLD